MKYGGTARQMQDQILQSVFDFNTGTVEIPEGYAVVTQVHDEIFMEQCDETVLSECNRCVCGHRGHFWSAYFELAFCSEKCYDQHVKLNGDGGSANAETKTNPV